jgi:hypothetical protein
MKNIIIEINLIFLIISLISCNKADIESNSLVGKWSVINDSTFTPIANIGASNYIGTSSDYYNFTANGSVYISLKTLLDTCTYSMIANNQINIVYSTGSYDSYYITNLTPNTVTLTLITPPLGPKEIINFKK